MRWRVVRQAILSLCLVSIINELATASDFNSDESRVDSVNSAVPKDMRWEPAWREPDDCGQMSLYVFLRLQGRPVTMQQIKESLPIIPNLGSAMDALAAASDKLGIPASVKFVEPSLVPSLPRPLILHSNGSIVSGKGHYTVITGYSSEKQAYSIINTEDSSYIHVPSASVLKNFSGYVLVPNTTNDNTKMAYLTGCSLVAVSIFLAVVLLRRRNIFQN